MADSVTFAGHPYGLSTYGSEQSLATIDSAMLSAYVRAQVVRSRMLVVVVGVGDSRDGRGRSQSDVAQRTGRIVSVDTATARTQA